LKVTFRPTGTTTLACCGSSLYSPDGTDDGARVTTEAWTDEFAPVARAALGGEDQGDRALASD
jgi:hypothetical protein